MRFKDPHSKMSKKDFEVNNQPSKTIPDQTLSIPELIKRYAQGLPLGAPKVALYDEDPENDILGGVNWNTLDLSEKQEFMNTAKNELNEISKRVNKRKSNTPQQIDKSQQQSEENNE